MIAIGRAVTAAAAIAAFALLAGCTAPIDPEEVTLGAPGAIKAAALNGLGPYACLAEVTSEFAGVLGIDRVFGQQRFFPGVMESRRTLRDFNLEARLALGDPEDSYGILPDPDVCWQNPRTAANRVLSLENTLRRLKAANNRQIQSPGLSPEQISEYVQNNNEIDTVLALMEPPEAEAEGGAPPLDKLQEGQVTVFKNGQAWTLQDPPVSA